MKNKKILIIQTAFLGDAILTLPMIQSFKKLYPHSSIEVLATPATQEIFKHSAYVDDVIIYDKHKTQKSFRQLYNIISLVRKKRFDSIYSPHRSFRTSLIVMLSRVKDRHGFVNSSCSFVYTDKINYESKIHEVARNLKLIGNEVAQSDWKIMPRLHIPERTNKRIREVISNVNGRRLISVAPGSVWETKKYPQKYFIEIINYLISQKYFIVLIGGKEDEFLCGDIKKNFASNVESYAGKLNTIESISLIKACSLLICNDSAPTHMGMAAGTPTLTIYCSTVRDFGFYPYNENSDYISFDDLKCKPCGIHGHNKCPENTFDCGLKLLPDLVIEKINRLLN